MGYEQVHQIAQDRNRWRAEVNTVFTTSNAFETERQNSLTMKRRSTARSRGMISALHGPSSKNKDHNPRASYSQNQMIRHGH
jgi:hypothetical protein